MYRLDGIEIDPVLNRIAVNGEERHLRPQTFQVLLHLLEHRDRVVSKEELMTAVWPDTAVTDDALVQCIVDIRREFGDDSRKATFVKTFPKRGYRFVAVVETVPRGRSTPPAAIDGADRPQASSLGRWMPVAAAAVLGIVIATAVLLARPARWFVASPGARAETSLAAVPAMRRIAVMFFENETGRPELSWLQVGLADMVITDLSRDARLSVLSRDQLSTLRERMSLRSAQTARLDQALQIANQSQADTLLLGSFAAVGDRTRIDVRLHDGRSGRLLGADAVVAETPDQILTQIDALSTRVRARLGIVDEAFAKTTLGGVMTDNLEAYRYYVLGVQQATELHVTDAIAMLQKAVAADPEFAMAYARIGYAYGVSNNQDERAKPFLEQAFRRSARLTEKDRLYIAAWYGIVSFDYQAAQSPLREIIRKDPAEIEAYKELGTLLQGDEDYAEAVDVLSRALALDPKSKEIYNALGAAYRDIGKYADAIAAHRQCVAIAPNEPNAWDSLGLTYQAGGDYGHASEAFERALQLNPTFEIPVVHLGNLYFQLGRYRQALRQYQRYVEIASFDQERTRGYAHIAWVHFRMGDRDRAWEFAQTALSHAYTPVVWSAIPIAAARGDANIMTDLRARFQAAPPTGNRGRRQTPALDRDVRGFLAMRDGKDAEAIALFREVVRHPPVFWNIEGFQTDLADAYLMLGRVKEAIAEYERVLALNPYLALARYHLGEAYDRLGDTARARAEYERFLRIWRDADPDVPELVAAKARLTTSATE